MLQLEIPREVWKRIKGYTKPLRTFPTNSKQILCWKSVRLSDRKPVVIKLFDWDIVEDIDPELQAVETLKDISHPNLVSVYDTGQNDDGVYYVMEYWGDDLRELLITPPHPDWVIKVMIEVLKGLVELHRHKMVHRDIKHENIYIKQDCVKIGDYGLVKSKRWMTVLKTIAGTRGYIAPEVLKGKSYDNRCDIYSVGMVLKELLSDFRSLRSAKLAEPYREIIRRATALRPDERFNSAEEFLKALQTLQSPHKQRDNRVAVSQKSVESALYRILSLLKNSNLRVRQTAADILIDLALKETVDRLIPLLSDANAQRRRIAAYILCYLGTEKSINEIIPLLKDPDNQVRHYVLIIIRKLHSKKAIPYLLPLLKDNDFMLRAQTVATLGELDAKEATEEIIPLLKDANLTVRGETVLALPGLIGKKSVPYLIPLLKDPQPDVRQRTCFVLGYLGNGEVIREIIPLLKDASPGVRLAAVDALTKLGAKQATREMLPLLKDTATKVRGITIFTLGKLGAREAINEIAELLNDTNEKIRGAAAIALVELGAKDRVPKKAVRDIKQYISEWNNPYNKRAQNALKKFCILAE